MSKIRILSKKDLFGCKLKSIKRIRILIAATLQLKGFIECRPIKIIHNGVPSHIKINCIEFSPTRDNDRNASKNKMELLCVELVTC